MNEIVRVSLQDPAYRRSRKSSQNENRGLPLIFCCKEDGRMVGFRSLLPGKTTNRSIKLFSQVPRFTRFSVPHEQAPFVGFEARSGLRSPRSEEHTSELQSPYVISYA